jgi:hypothetical protein
MKPTRAKGLTITRHEPKTFTSLFATPSLDISVSRFAQMGEIKNRSLVKRKQLSEKICITWQQTSNVPRETWI